jgi:hypothetical protein
MKIFSVTLAYFPKELEIGHINLKKNPSEMALSHFICRLAFNYLLLLDSLQ